MIFHLTLANMTSINSLGLILDSTMAYFSRFVGVVVDLASGDSDIGLGYKHCGNLHYNGTVAQNASSGKWEYSSKIISSDTIMQRRECLVGKNRSIFVNWR